MHRCNVCPCCTIYTTRTIGMNMQRMAAAESCLVEVILRSAVATSTWTRKNAASGRKGKRPTLHATQLERRMSKLEMQINARWKARTVG